MRRIKELAHLATNTIEYKREHYRLTHTGAIVMKPMTLQEHIQAFDEKRGIGSFTHLVELLSTPCNTYENIGKVFGVSRERVRQWRVRYADDFGWHNTGFQRRNYCTITSRIERVLNTPNPPLVQLFIDKLAKVGIVGKFIVGVNNLKKTKTLSVNGHRCKLSFRQTSTAISGTDYFNFYTFGNVNTMKGHDIQLFGCGEDTVFVVPVKELLFHYPNGHIYLPVSFANYGYKGRTPRIDWRQYKDSWHLIASHK